jgi:hypothetical protein
MCVKSGGEKQTVLFLMLAATGIATVPMYCALFYPGYLTADSVYMMNQAVGAAPLSDWHPPFVTWLWGVLIHVYGTSGALWTLQVLLYVFVCGLVAYIAWPSAWALIGFVLLVMWPPIVTNMAALWKDNWALIAMLLAYLGLLLACRKDGGSAVLICGAGCVLAALMRSDYLIVALPLLAGSLWYQFRHGRAELFNRLWKCIAISLVFIASFLVVNKAATWNLEKDLNPWITVAIWDIGGATHFGEQKLYPEYSPATSDTLAFGESFKQQINLPEGPQVRGSDVEAREWAERWVSTVSDNPYAYLQHRIGVAQTFLGLRSEIVHHPYPRPLVRDDWWTTPWKQSEVNRQAYFFFDRIAHTAFYRYWVYLVCIIACMLLLYLCGSFEIVAISLAMSVFACLARVIILPAADFRYGLWILVGALLMLVTTLSALSQFVAAMCRARAFTNGRKAQC